MKKVLFNCPYAGSGAIKWIVASWREGFKVKGYEFHLCEDDRHLPALLASLKPDILFCDVVSTRVEDSEIRACLKQARAAGTKVVMNIFWPLEGQPFARSEAVRRYDVADLYCGEREPDSMTRFQADCGGRLYITMPHAANPRFHFPTSPIERYRYDVVFLGAKLPHKRWFNDKIVGQLRRRYNVGLFGPNWTLRDNLIRAGSKIARKAGAPRLARMFDRQRVYIPEEDENKLYSSAKIALSFHEREPDFSQPHHVVNQRTFKVPACGGFLIVDPVQALSKYFADDEMVTAGFEEREWLDRIDYYLEHDDERRAIQQRATKRALGEHMSHHRVELLERSLGFSL